MASARATILIMKYMNCLNSDAHCLAWLHLLSSEVANCVEINKAISESQEAPSPADDFVFY